MTPEAIGKYTVRGTLGRGAMGVVHDGWDPAIGRRVAIKTIRLADAREDEEAAEALERFRREAQAAGRLSHPNIVGVYDTGETDELAYIVMEFIEGRSLKSVLDSGGALPAAEVAEIMGQVLAGLDYSHRRGVIHRDIKPANVMLTAEGAVKLADFGIARVASSTATAVGTVLGTPAYMPPEQFLGEPADERSDIYAAGAMLFHLLTGARPYEGSPTSIMTRVLNAPSPPSASERSVSVNPAWDPVVARAMARRPEDRFATAAEFARAVQAAAAPAPDSDATVIAAPARPPPAAAPPAAPPPPRGAAGGGPARLVVPIALVTVLAAAGAAAWLFTRPAPPPTPPPPPVPAPTSSRPPPPSPPRQPPPATAPNAVQLDAALAPIPCSTARASDSGGALHIAGLAGETHAGSLQSALDSARLTADAIATVPDTYCSILDILRDRRMQPGLKLRVPEAGGQALSAKTFFHPTIGPLPFDAWIRVDYFSGDGTVLHLLPTRGAGRYLPEPALRLKAGETVRLGDGAHSRLRPGPPYGTDLIVATASPDPAFAAVRPAFSEAAAAYLSALRGFIEQADAARAPIAFGSMPLRTTGP